MKLILVDDQGNECQTWDVDLLRGNTKEEVGGLILTAIIAQDITEEEKGTWAFQPLFGGD